MNDYLLSLLVFVPLLGCLGMLLVPRAMGQWNKYIALAVTAVQLLIAAAIYMRFPTDGSGKGVFVQDQFFMVERVSWLDMSLGRLGRVHVDYFLGVDGLNASLLLLAALVLVIGVVASWKVTRHAKGYFALYMLLSSSIMGSFLALDMFLFYLFFEFMLLPMYFLIGIWGGKRRLYASIKFFLYTLTGSIFILIVMIGLYASVYDGAKTAVYLGEATSATEVTQQQLASVRSMVAKDQVPDGAVIHTFDMLAMTEPGNYIPGSVLDVAAGGELWGMPVRLWACLAILLGFLIKLPAVPVHTWLPDAHVEAPTAISIILAGVLLKVGGYGLVRIVYPIFPDGVMYFSWLLGLLGVVAIIYGALNALASADLKRMIAYSSVSHMGFVVMGLAALTEEGVSGAIYQMFSHGLISSMLFLIAGVIYDRTQDRTIEFYSGLAQKMPRFTVVVVIGFFAGLGLPGFSGFIAELLVLLGSFRAGGADGLLAYWMPIAATLGLVLGAGYFLWALQRMFFGKYLLRKPEWDAALTDLSLREWLMFVPLIALVILFGIFPSLLLNVVNASVDVFTDTILDRAAMNWQLMNL